jgi:hypothetical protein
VEIHELCSDKSFRIGLYGPVADDTATCWLTAAVAFVMSIPSVREAIIHTEWTNFPRGSRRNMLLALQLLMNKWIACSMRAAMCANRLKHTLRALLQAMCPEGFVPGEANSPAKAVLTILDVGRQACTALGAANSFDGVAVRHFCGEEEVSKWVSPNTQWIVCVNQLHCEVPECLRQGSNTGLEVMSFISEEVSAVVTDSGGASIFSYSCLRSPYSDTFAEPTGTLYTHYKTLTLENTSDRKGFWEYDDLLFVEPQGFQGGYIPCTHRRYKHMLSEYMDCAPVLLLRKEL